METAAGLLGAIIVVFGGWVFYSAAMFFYRVPAQLKRIADALEKGSSNETNRFSST